MLLKRSLFKYLKLYIMLLEVEPQQGKVNYGSFMQLLLTIRETEEHIRFAYIYISNYQPRFEPQGSKENYSDFKQSVK